MHVAIAYDCLFPLTVGGAERWYRALADHLVADGCRVTYLTRQQWPDGDPPRLEGVDVVAVSRREELYDAEGTRLLGPTLRFGAGVARHLRRHRHDYDVVHTASFPFWSVLGARAALGRDGWRLVVDWHEVWGGAFWRAYAGRLAGTAGHVVQRLCIAASPHPVTTSDLNAGRFVAAGGRVPVVLPGFFPTAAPVEPGGPRVGQPGPGPAERYAVFAGRHIADKGVDLLPGIAEALARLAPGTKVVVAGDGPQRQRVERAVVEAGLGGVVRFVGFVGDDDLRRFLGGAGCLLVPSRREGYCLVVVEAARLGTPAVVAGFPENLAAGHIVEGVNGTVVAPDPEALAAAVASVIGRGDPLRDATLRWYGERAPASTMEASLARVSQLHREIVDAGPPPPRGSARVG